MIFFAKKIFSMVMAFSMAVTSTLPGVMGDYAKLQKKAFEIDSAKSETVINLSIDINGIEEVIGGDIIPDDFEIPGLIQDGKLNVSSTIYTFADSASQKMAISFGDDLQGDKVIYLDEEGVALTAGVVDTALYTMAMFGDKSDVKKYEVYKKYFDGNGAYFTWNEIFGLDDQADGENAAINEIVQVIAEDLFEIVTTEENIQAFCGIYAPLFENSQEFFTVETVDGVKAYSCKMTGVEYAEYYAESLAMMYSEETADKVIDYIINIAGEIDYIKYMNTVEKLYPEIELGLPQGLSNEMIASIVTGMIEGYREDFVSMYTDMDSESTAQAISVVITGKDENGKYPELVALNSALSPILENSYAQSQIYEKNGSVCENSKVVLSDGKTEYLSLETATTVKKHDGILPDAKNVVPFDMRVETIEIENKLGYEEAIEKGVQSLEISWNSFMYPDENELHIYYPYFCVTYNTTMADSIMSDPVFAEMEPEYKQAVLEMYGDEYDYRFCDTTAHLIENSVYLPLRQLMENAGYEVSWDGQARKAYVTVDGVKVEMTGTIINDRTYVKVRDFEKLGATVEYEEEFYYENAYNDFDKDCRALITFAK